MLFIFHSVKFFICWLGRYLYKGLLVSSVLTLSLSVFADESAVNAKALEQTMEMLQNRMQREEAIKGDKDAEKADNMAKDLVGGGENLEKLYKLSAKVFRDVANKKNGNLTDMMETLQKAQQDPEGFYKNLTPEQKKMVEQISKDVKINKNDAQP